MNPPDEMPFREVKKQFEIELNNGGVKITLSSTTGNVYLRKK